MTPSQNLVFLTDPVTAFISVTILLITAGVSIYSWRRGGYQRIHGLQETLRVLIVVFVLALLNQPEWVEEFHSDEKPTISVIWDHSGSMETKDVLPDNATSGEAQQANAISRSQSIQSLIKPETWSQFADKLEINFEPIASNDESPGSNLYEPLSKAPERLKNLLGVVLISDGDWNTGKPPVEAASELRMKGIPVFTVTAGNSSRLPDIDLVNVDLPTFAIAGKPVRVPFTIESSLPHEYHTTVSFTTSEGDTLTKDVRVAPMGRTSDALTWRPTKNGDFTVSVEVPRHANETIIENNTKTVPIAIREEKLKVLVVDSVPRWEYRYLRNALSRDPGVDVSCMLFHPGLEKAGGGSQDYIKEFPNSLEELSKYDVVFLGDIGFGSDGLTEDQCRLVKGLVEHQASGLVFLPGAHGAQLSLMETELKDLYPVIVDETQPGGWGSRTAANFELTERGRSSLLTKLADTAEDNAIVWEGLPGFQWHSAVLRAKAGTEVLAVHSDSSNEFGRIPLLVTRTFGAGKVLFMGTDAAWRWRKGVEDKYHYRFWGQVVRWMAYQRNMSKGESMRLYHTPDQPQVRRTIAFHAHVMDDAGGPLLNGEVMARIQSPSGKIETVRFLSAGDEWGVFQGSYSPQESGQYKVTLISNESKATLESQFFVQGDALEQQGKPARPEVLEEIARISRGKSLQLNQLEEVLNSIAELPSPPPVVRRLQLWNSPYLAGALIFLLGGFWIWRKQSGMM
ncbi:hypothetical protein SH668x_003798 [Planctomicrobium sp. SH668]|uniref:hypothetical protein n=1 Tax=Planctomicrobium sp. SH668 TaxID=3448126 RepID=UPI003F5BDD8A